MKKKLLKYLVVFSTMLCILVALLISVYYYGFYKKNEIKTIKSEAIIFSSLLNNGKPTEELKGVQSGSTRITLISKSGQVLFDTDADKNQLENHLGRAEIQQALKDGEGSSLRYSETLKENLYYYAVRLSDGSVLRISRPLNGITNVFMSSIPFLVLFIVIAIIIADYITVLLTDRIVKPLNIASQQLETVLTDDYVELEELAAYDEFLPFIRKIRGLNIEIRNYAKQLKNQNNTINSITSTMQEGLIVLDGKQHIISINTGAIKMMGLSPDKNYINQSLISICRSTKVLGAVENVISKKTNTYLDIENKQQFHKYYFSPVLKENGGIRGIIILIVNATAEMRSERIRRDFASNVSHELKTPLTSISGFSEMLENSMIENKDDIIKTASMIHRESSRMILLIDDIIRLSQIESSDDIPTENANAADIINEVARSLHSVAEEKSVSLLLALQQVHIDTNPSMLYELVFNLCDNAIKYNRPDGEVTVSLSEKENNAIITVSDTGIGIVEEHLDRIFERFYRVDKSRSKQTGGTGLGLSIVKHIAESLKGHIDIKSELGKGTEITVTLPML